MRAQRPGDGSEGKALPSKFPCPSGIHVVLSGSTEVPALRTGTTDPGQYAVPDQIPLELRDGGQHVEEEPPRGRRRIDGLVEHDEIDAERLELLRQRDQMVGAAGQAVELGADHYVNFAGPGGAKEGVESRASLLRT